MSTQGQWLQCMQPATAEHPRVLRACPPNRLHEFWASVDPSGAPGAWFLPGDDPKWEMLPLWSEVVAPVQVSDAELIRQRDAKIEAFGVAQMLWEDNVKATEWGSDPLWWLPISQLDPTACWFDRKLKTLRYPYQELMTRYGTVNLQEYAAARGMPPPKLEL